MSEEMTQSGDSGTIYECDSDGMLSIRSFYFPETEVVSSSMTCEDLGIAER